MAVVLDVILFVLGGVIIGATMTSAIKSTVLPRAVDNRLVAVVASSVEALFRLRLRRTETYEARDRTMAFLGPVTLILLLVAWLSFILVAYTCIYLAIDTSSLRKAVELSGSSITTLGTTASHRLWTELFTYSEAALGLILLTLLISYLPSIYAAFSRREQGVTLLVVRAGLPPSATTMLIRYARIEEFNLRLTELWRTGESWFADLEESHTSFPILAFFRSPQSHQSWINSAGVLLDAASLWVSSVAHPPDPDAQLCIRAGFLSLRRIAASLGLSEGPPPVAGDPITITRGEFDDACAAMEAAGIELAADRDGSWESFSGWRVNYDVVLLNLARLVEAPPAPWISDRTPLAQEHPRSLRRRLLRTRREGSPRATSRWPHRSR